MSGCCEHGVQFHHETRGCGYYGFTPERRCPCGLTPTQAVAVARLIAEAEERGAAKVRESLRVAARHPHKGPNDTDASMLREASKRLRAGYEPGGSWTKQTVAQVAEAVADVIEAQP